jgi:hypothetical protein
LINHDVYNTNFQLVITVLDFCLRLISQPVTQSVTNIHFMKKLLLVMLVVVPSLCGFSQMVKPFVVNSAGGSAVIGGNSYDWSFAEMVMISTTSNANLIVTAGLLQPIDPNVGVAELESSRGGVKVYPNPVDDLLNLESSFQAPGNLSYQLFDMAGKQLILESSNLQAGENLQKLSLKDFAPGNYLLKVIFSSDKTADNFMQTFKIQKVQ